MDATDEKNNQTGEPGPDGNGDNLRRLTTYPAIRLPTRLVAGRHQDRVREHHGTGNSGEIYVMNAVGESATNSTFAPHHQLGGATSAQLVAGRHHGRLHERAGRQTQNIWIMNADGSEQKRLTRKAAADYDPAWSPDGKKIVFETTRGGGDPEIYVMKARPEGKRNRPKNLTTNKVEDPYPDWQPDS